MRYPRFSLRLLLVCVAIISLPMGWVGYQLNWIRQRHEMLQTMLAQGRGGGIHVLNPEGCPWALRFFGERAVDYVEVDHSQAAWAQRLFPEAQIRIVTPDTTTGSMQ